MKAYPVRGKDPKTGLMMTKWIPASSKKDARLQAKEYFGDNKVKVHGCFEVKYAAATESTNDD